MPAASRNIFYFAYIAFAVATCRDWTSFLLCIPIFLISIKQIEAIQTSSITPEDIFWFCIFLYFGVVPTQALSDGQFPATGPTSGIRYPASETTEAMAVVLIFLAGFLLSKRFLATPVSTKTNQPEETPLGGISTILLGILIASSFALYVFLAGGIANVLLPRTERDAESINFAAYLFLSLGCVGLYIVSYDIFRLKDRNTLKLATAVAGCMLLGISINIYNSPRFFLVSCWAPLFMIALPKLTYRSLYTASAVMIFVIMPLLSITTRYGSTDTVLPHETEEVSPFLIRDVDIFETATHSIQFSEKREAMLGDNLLAIFLFFVPRTIWQEKPIVGGLLIGNELYGIGTATTPNLSYFPAFDGYLDFGLFGAFAFGAIFGFAFYKIRNFGNDRGRRQIMNLILCAALPILLRGPLGAVIGFPLCLLVSAWLLLKVYKT